VNVTYSGWTSEHGSFHCDIYIDENKTDYEIHFGDGSVMYQSTPFHSVTADWNHDDDIYTEFGAFFNHKNEKGEFTHGSFWTPAEMVRAVADAVEKLSEGRQVYSNEVIRIPGIEIPMPEKRPSLENHLRNLEREERRKDYQDIERNRKMSSLGIRGPGEPWAK